MPSAGAPRPRGMALIAVLWIVAALSLMVIGLTGTVRQQIQITGAQRDQVTGQAIGEAAMAQVLQELLVTPNREPGIVSLTVPYGGADIAVEVTPLNGLISLNEAEPSLLENLLRTAGGLDPGRASALATEIVVWRDSRPPVDPTSPGAASVEPRRFEAPEDLMLVPGIDYPLYARLAPLVTADLTGARQINPLAAPPSVLAVLAGGNTGRVAAFVNQRASGSVGLDTSGFQNAAASARGTDLYRLRAKVPLGEGRILLLTRDVALGTLYSRSAPWRTLRTERQMIAPAT